VSDGRNREGEIIARLAAEVEIAQKRPERSNQLLCGWGSTSAGTFQKKVAYCLRSPLTDILAERLEQLRGTASVLPKSWLLHPAMRFKPVAEGSHKS
jgi:hypothetical protein